MSGRPRMTAARSSMPSSSSGLAATATTAPAARHAAYSSGASARAFGRNAGGVKSSSSWISTSAPLLGAADKTFSLAPSRNSQERHNLAGRILRITPGSLEGHVQAFGDCGAETGGDGDAAAHLLLRGVGGPDRIAAAAEERIGVRRLGLGGVDSAGGIGVAHTELF